MKRFLCRALFFTICLMAWVYGNAQGILPPYSELINAAKKGDANSQALVAICFKNGYTVPIDTKKAWSWAIASSNHTKDGLAYWIMAQLGREAGDDPKNIKSYLDSAVAYKYPLALSMMGRMYYAGNPTLGIRPNKSRAIELLKLAAENEDYDAASYLGYQFLQDEAKQDDAFHYMSIAAQNNDGEYDGEEMSLLANMYSNGIGTVRDESKAFEWYNKAAEIDSTYFIEGLADCYRLGLGTRVNQAEAFRLYSRLEAFTPRQLYLMGFYYNSGIGTNANYSLALSMLRQSSYSGFVFAQAILGIAQYEGEPPFIDKNDISLALPFIKSAYENKDFNQLPSIYKYRIYRYMSGYYRYGRGFEQNLRIADELLAKADDVQSHSEATSFPCAFIGMISIEESLAAYKRKGLSPADQYWNMTLFSFSDPDSKILLMR